MVPQSTIEDARIKYKRDRRPAQCCRAATEVTTMNMQIKITRYLMIGMLFLTGCATTPPQNPGQLRKDAVAYSLAGMQDLAIKSLSQAIALEPDQGNNFHLRGTLYYRQKRYDDALADLTRAIDLNPGDRASLCNRGAVYHALGRYEQAIGDLTRGLELNPRATSCYNSRGMVYSDMGAYERALPDFNKAIEVDSAYYSAYANAARAYNGLGKKREAIEAVKNFLKYVPRDAAHAHEINEAEELIRTLEKEISR